MRTKTTCGLMRCVRENSFCVFYLVGLALAMSFITTLIFNGGVVLFVASFVGLILLGGWYLRTCYVYTRSSHEDYPEGKTARKKT
jgi:hypothetical protein